MKEIIIDILYKVTGIILIIKKFLDMTKLMNKI